ncbi:MAG: M28 family peptidase [Cytophagales bacterium]
MRWKLITIFISLQTDSSHMFSKSKVFLFSIIFSFTYLIFSCEKPNEVKQKTSAEKTNQSLSVNFNADSAYFYIEKQVNFGKRVPNTKAHVITKDYLVSKLEQFGWKTQIQSFEANAFDGKKLKLFNIIASYNPESSKRILLCAHWDTRPFADQEESLEKKYQPIDGANDGASGVAVLLEIARTISNSTQKPNIGIDIVLFDGEDYGQPDFIEMDRKSDTWCLGSQHWSKNPHVANYQAYYGILLDMVGAKNAKFALDGTSRYFAPGIQKKVWDKANALGYGNYFVYTETEEIIDDHYYINKIAKIPTIDIIDYDPSDGAYFGNYWHKHEDNLDSIDKNTLFAVGTVVLHLLYED